MKKRSYELPERLDETERRNTGAFYTPPEIVDFMVKKKKREKIYAFYIGLCKDLADMGY